MKEQTTQLKRRGFLAGMLSMAAAPAIVRASSLMPIVAAKSHTLIGSSWWMTESFSMVIANSRSPARAVPVTLEPYEQSEGCFLYTPVQSVFHRASSLVLL